MNAALAARMPEEPSEFNPRLRLDLSSGRAQLRSLTVVADEVPRRQPLSASHSPTGLVPPVTADFERAITLLRGRHTQDMHERHIAALHRICKQCAGGFFVHDLGSVEIILGCTARQLRAGHADYVQAVCEMLRLLALPMRKERSSDDVRYEQQCTSLIRTASSLLRLGVPPVALATAEMLLALVSLPTSPPTSLTSPRSGSPRPSSPTMRPSLQAARAHQLVAQSGAVQNLVAVLSSDSISAPVLASMRALRAFSRHQLTAVQILRAEHIGSLLGMLQQPLGEPILHMTVEVIWNLLDAAAAEAAAVLCKRAFLDVLLELLQRTLGPSSREIDREMRNELLVLATRIAQGGSVEDRGLLVTTGWLSHVVEFIESDQQPPGANGRQLELGPPTPLTCELLMLSLHFLQTFTGAELPHDALASVKILPLAELLSHYLRPDSPAKWNSMQLSELRRLSIAVLCNLSHLLSASESLASALELALPFIESAKQPELREGTLRLLIDALSNFSELQDRLGEAGAVGQLVSVLSGMLGGMFTSSVSYSSSTELLRPQSLSTAAAQDVLVAMSLLCDGHELNRQIFGESGGVAALQSVMGPSSDTRLTFAATDCLWTAVAPSHTNTMRLVERDGILQLMDLLERCSFGPRAHLLACLADLVAHPAAAAQCAEWNGERQQSAVQLLLQFWQEEEARLAGASGRRVLKSKTRPLSELHGDAADALNKTLRIGGEGDDSSEEEAEEADGSVPLSAGLGLTTMAQLQIFGRFEGLGSSEAAPLEGHDLRAKVFAVINQLQFESSSPLSPEEKLVLETVRAFPTLCAAEAWRDVHEELDASEMTRPVTADRVKLEGKLAELDAAAAAVADRQERIVEDEIKPSVAAAEAAMIDSVRVQRDGPLGAGVKVEQSSRSLLRSRMAAKERLADMVSTSHVEFKGPRPTKEEYADAAIASVEEALGDEAEFKVRHAEAALVELARTTGETDERVAEFLRARAAHEGAARLEMEVELNSDSVQSRVAMRCVDPEERLDRAQMRALCVEFLGS